MIQKTTHQKRYDEALLVFTENDALRFLPQGEKSLKLIMPALQARWAAEMKTQPEKKFLETCIEVTDQLAGRDLLQHVNVRTAAYVHLLTTKKNNTI